MRIFSLLVVCMVIGNCFVTAQSKTRGHYNCLPITMTERSTSEPTFNNPFVRPAPFPYLPDPHFRIALTRIAAPSEFRANVPRLVQVQMPFGLLKPGSCLILWIDGNAIH